MKRNFILLLVLVIQTACFAQYIGVRARYTETRLVDDSPNPPKRENRLILSFYTVSDLGVYTPAVLNNYDIWIYKQGLQYGSYCGGVLDSCGNNYPGYAWTAPKAVAYFNSYHENWIDCDPNLATHYVVNGHELDCGFIGVSYWDIDHGNGQSYEAFTAPNVCLRYYFAWEYPYGILPGNVNFTWPIYPTAPYNWYSFSCYQSTQQIIIRGVLPHDTSLSILPVRFDNVRVSLYEPHKAKVSWSNLTESDIHLYEVQRSADGQQFQTTGIIFPLHNNGGRADYEFREILPGNSTTYYYRIRATETSGQHLFSQVVRIQTRTESREDLLNVFLNPVTGSTISLQTGDLHPGRYHISLVNAAGQEIKVKEFVHSGGALSQILPLPVNSNGIYQLVIRSADNVFSKRIFIKN